MTPIVTTHDIHLDGIGPVPLTVSGRGQGRPVLVLHGGAGPQTVGEFADLLAQTQHLNVLTPIHPGFGGTPRPEGLDSVAGLANLYLALLDRLDLVDVTVIGNSVGGWIAAELALLESARIARVVLVDATGIEVPGHPVADVSGMTLPEILGSSYHHAAPFRIDPATLPPAARRIAAGNMAALAVYGGGRATDPSLLGRLLQVKPATVVVWGDSDHIVDAEYGRAYAAAIPGASFQLVTNSGHLPQVETPDQVVTAVARFLTASPAWQHDYTENTTATPDDVWAALRALYTGTKFNDSGDDIVIHGPFAAGTKLSVTPHGADFVVECRITEVLVTETFAYRSNFNGLHLTSRHRLTRLAGGGTRITHHSEIAGPGAEVTGPKIGARITDDRAETMRDLINAATKS